MAGAISAKTLSLKSVELLSIQKNEPSRDCSGTTESISRVVRHHSGTTMSVQIPVTVVTSRRQPAAALE